MSKVINFEISADDPQRAIQFYQDVFGWKFQTIEGTEFWPITAGDDSEPGINGGLLKRADPSSSTVNSINVSSVDQTVAKITRRGGQVVVPKTAIPGVGYIAYFVDTESNVFGLFQSDPSAKVATPLNVPTSIR